MIPRDAAAFARQNASWFPIVSITGPRQSGKSTLVRAVFPSYDYVNLENPETLERARQDPVGFVRDRGARLVIDEAQLVPELFSVIQVLADERGGVGQYVLSGSQNFLMHRHVTQSLAGRVGIVRLPPLSFREASLARESLAVDEFTLLGGYPRLYDVGIPAEVYYRNYVATYVERDVDPLVSAGSLPAFRLLLELCAQSCGSLLNITRLAGDVGVSAKTVRAWLSILEASYVTLRLQPYHANLRKRLTKTPKLYFWDTGLLCHLLGIATPGQLRDSPMRGAVFENLVLAETFKRHLNGGAEPRLFFYRDDSKREVDLVDATDRANMELAEIKASQTYRPDFMRHLVPVGDDLGVPPKRQAVVMRSDESHAVLGRRVWSARDWLLRWAEGF